TALASGTISGQVKDSVTTVGIGGAQVEFYDLNGNSDFPVYTATADGTGHYTQSVPDGTYGVLTHAPGNYINQIWNGISCSAVCNIGSQGANITHVVVAGNAVAGIDFSLVSGGGQVAGTVTSTATGLPLAGVTVYVIDAGGNVPFASAVTDASGH